MHAPIKRRKKRGTLYFSSTKALKTSRLERKKVAPERYETNGINKILDFEDTGENATLSMVDESQGLSTFQGRESHCLEPSKDVRTHSNHAINPALQEESGEEKVEETSLMEPEGGFPKP